MGIPGGLMSGLALWQLSANSHRPKAPWIAGRGRVAMAGRTGNSPGHAEHVYGRRAIGNQGAEFLASAQYLSQAVLALCALGAWTGLGIYRSQLDSADGRCRPLPLARICAAIVLSVAIGFAAMDREYLTEAGLARQSHRRRSGRADSAGRLSPPESHANRTWEQIVADRRHNGFELS